ncbi:MAG: hypothetical protein PSX71_14015 [bacterium]|nr:hypothetical protein [bacterium]
MATSAFMQSAFMSGIPYGMHGVPNMQTLLELGGMSADELEGVRDSIVGDIDDLLLPFFIEGKLPEMPDSRALPYEGFEDEGAASIVSKMVDTGAALRGILDGIKAGKEKGEATAAEVELVEDISDGFALVKEICADAAVKLLQLDEVRWPDSPKVKGAVVFGAQLAGLDLKGLSITVK